MAKTASKKKGRKMSGRSRVMNAQRRATTKNKRKQQTEHTLHDVFIMELQDIYDAEHQILKALPKMIKKAQNPDLKMGFEEHEMQTREQVRRLEEVFGYLDEKPKRKKCSGMEGLLEEGKHVLEMKADANTMDAALAASAQKVEHYEISAYGTMCEWAKVMGHDAVVDLLKQNMGEEEDTDKILTELSEGQLNQAAMDSGMEMGMHDDMQGTETEASEREEEREPMRL